MFGRWTSVSRLKRVRIGGLTDRGLKPGRSDLRRQVSA
jgi:hypothetical protein